jgi:hypothetical protein
MLLGDLYKLCSSSLLNYLNFFITSSFSDLVQLSQIIRTLSSPLRVTLTGSKSSASNNLHKRNSLQVAHRSLVTNYRMFQKYVQNVRVLIRRSKLFMKVYMHTNVQRFRERNVLISLCGENKDDVISDARRRRKR